MRVVCVTGSHEARHGGIPTVVNQLAKHVGALGLNVEIISVGNSPLPPPAGVKLTNAAPARLSGAWRWGWDLGRTIRTAAEGPTPSVFHLNGIWQASQWYAARAARRKQIPTVLSPHGQLKPPYWGGGDRSLFHRLRKGVYWRLVASPAFRSAETIHAITLQEKESLSAIFKDQVIALIPNAADLDEIDLALAALPASVQRDTIIAFLGRFHPNKGPDILIRAFAEADLHRDWRLMLAGPPGPPAYMRLLTELVNESPVKDRIRFVGPLFGEAKWKLYRMATAVAVPSVTEVMGMVNLESAACGTPTVTTHETGLEDWQDAGGMLVRPTVGDLANALALIASLSADEYRSRSLAARRHIESRYSWRVVRQRWYDLYTSLV